MAKVFLDDILLFMRMSRRRSDPYYLGTMIVYSDDKDPKGVFALMDGQQRWTTITSLMGVIFHLLDSDGSGSDWKKIKSEISETFLNSNHVKPQPRLSSGRDYDNYTLEKLCKFNGDQDPNSLSPELEDFPHIPSVKYKDIEGNTHIGTNLYCVSRYFLDRLKSEFDISGPLSSRKSLSKFYEFVKTRLFLNLTLAPNATVAYKMFITANARGTPLTNFDIFRGLVLSKELDLDLDKADYYSSILDDANNTLLEILKIEGKADPGNRTNQIMSEAVGIIEGQRITKSQVLQSLTEMIEDMTTEQRLTRLCEFIKQYLDTYLSLRDGRRLAGDRPYRRMSFAGFAQHEPIYIAALMRWRDYSRFSTPHYTEDIHHLMRIVECFYFRLTLTGRNREVTLAFHSHAFQIAKMVYFPVGRPKDPEKSIDSKIRHSTLKEISKIFAEHDHNPASLTTISTVEAKVKLSGYGNNLWVSAFYALEKTLRIPISKGAGKNKTYFLVSMMPSSDEDYFKRKPWDYGQELTVGTPGSKTIGNQFLVYDYWTNIRDWSNDPKSRINTFINRSPGIKTTQERLKVASKLANFSHLSIHVNNTNLANLFDARFPEDCWLPDIDSA